MNLFLRGCRLPPLLGIYLGAKLLDHMVTLCLTFGKPARLFSKQLLHFTLPLAVWEGSDFSVSTPTPGFSILAMLVGVKWYVFVVLLCISY